MNFQEVKRGLFVALDRLGTGKLEYFGLVKGPLLIRIVGLVTAYILAILLARGFGATAFGMYSISLVVLGIASAISRLGIDYAAVKFIPSFLVKNETSKVSAYYTKSLLIIVALSLVASAILYYSASSLSLYVFQKPELGAYLRAFSFAITPFTIIQYHSEITRSFSSAVKSTLLTTSLIPSFALLVLLVFTLFPGLGFNEIYNIYVLACVFVAVASFRLVQKDFADNKISYADYSHELPITPVLQVSLPMFFFGTSLMLTTWINTLMLGSYASADDVAVYTVVVRLAGLSVLVLSTVNTVFSPKFSGHYSRGDYSSMRSETLKATKLNFWLGLPIQLLLMISAGFLLDLFGDGFRQGLVPLFVMLGAQVLNSVCGPVAQILNMANSQKFLSLLTFSLVPFTVISNLILFNYFDPVLAVTIGIAANYLILNAVCVFRIRSKWGFTTVYIPGFTTYSER